MASSIASSIANAGQPMIERAVAKAKQINDIGSEAIATSNRKNLDGMTNQKFADLGAQIGLEKGIGIDIQV